MSKIIKVRRGLKSELPILALGELGLTTDTNELYIGSLQGNFLVNKKPPRLATKNTVYRIDGTEDLGVIEKNYLLNSNFYSFTDGETFTINPGEDIRYTGDLWRIKTVDATVSAKKKDSQIGGLELDVTFGETLGYAYIRQEVLNVMQFSNKTLTFYVDIEVNQSCGFDLYIQARPNANDLARIPVTDTNTYNLTIGRQTVAVTFDVPNLSSFIGILDYKNSLEFAYRLTDTNKVVNAKIYSCGLYDGVDLKIGGAKMPSENITDVEYIFEKGTVAVAGLSATSGQKRLTAQYRQRKYRNVSPIISDLVGNVGFVSTYDVAGTRTDSVAYTALDATPDHVTVIINNSTACGIAFQYEVDGGF